jgi:hypothetical protein
VGGFQRARHAHADGEHLVDRDALDPVALRQRPGQNSITMYGRPSAEIPAW